MIFLFLPLKKKCRASREYRKSGEAKCKNGRYFCFAFASRHVMNRRWKWNYVSRELHRSFNHETVNFFFVFSLRIIFAAADWHVNIEGKKWLIQLNPTVCSLYTWEIIKLWKISTISSHGIRESLSPFLFAING